MPIYRSLFQNGNFLVSDSQEKIIKLTTEASLVSQKRAAFTNTAKQIIYLHTKNTLAINKYMAILKPGDYYENYNYEGTLYGLVAAESEEITVVEFL